MRRSPPRTPARRLVSAAATATPPLLFTENETNNERIFGTPNATRYVKDGDRRYVVAGRPRRVNPELGPAPRRQRIIGSSSPPGRPQRSACGCASIPDSIADPAFGSGFEQIIEARRREADEFYRSITPAGVGDDAARVMRQALAGMLWSKQFYLFDAHQWLEEHGAEPMQPLPAGSATANGSICSADHVISMPDKWEYPWFAAWDLAFHSIALAAVDIDFAKQQLGLLLDSVYLHPTGQIPAYEWNFSDVNPPVQAWAAIFLYRIEQEVHGNTDLDFLKRVFGKLSANFGWWINRKDRLGKNVFEGGFLGLDNIGVFDRSAPLPTGGYLEQADGTAWMALLLPEHARNRLRAGGARPDL